MSRPVLIASRDPTDNGGIVAGFGDLREVELLVEAGFTLLEAILNSPSGFTAPM